MFSNWKYRVIALIVSPAFGFLLAYNYESEYCRAFRIPNEFIELNWTTILGAVSVTLFVLILMFMISEGAFQIVTNIKLDSKGVIKKRVIFLSPLILITILSVTLYGAFWKEYIWILLAATFFIFLEFVFPIIVERKTKGYINKLIANDERDVGRETLLSTIFSSKSRSWLLVIVILIMIWIVSGVIGHSNAKRQWDFLIPSTYPEAVVLRIYGERMICAEFDRDNKEIYNTYFIIMADELPKPMFLLEEVGPLSLKTDD